jgi:hypothetical protein
MIVTVNSLMELSAEKTDDGGELSSVGHASIKKLGQYSKILKQDVWMSV